MDPISRKPYGPAADKGCIERPDIRRYLTHSRSSFNVVLANQGGVHIRFNRRFSHREMFPRLAFVALRTIPMPYRVLKLAENYA